MHAGNGARRVIIRPNPTTEEIASVWNKTKTGKTLIRSKTVASPVGNNPTSQGTTDQVAIATI